ncbi:MAG: VanW family protein [Candidatus Taylorbacteria bacterium]|nr:VanW family protein [Candidatus Taylorbacteria bacterium]
METNEILEIVRKKVLEDTSGRRALSLRYPLFLPLILGTRRFANNLANSINTNLTSKKAVGNKSQAFFDCVIARHSSPLFRKLGDFDQDLLTGKVENLKIAIDALQGTIIYPNEIFSFWHIVGDTTKKKGYVDGMLLSDGKIVRGIGGGLCQLSNLLYWLFLHSSVEIVERMHHSRDVFPDNERTIPFGSGATIFYNLIDLKVRNTSKYPIQLKLWLSESQLKGQTADRLCERKR